MSAISVSIIESGFVIRQGLISLLSRFHDIEVQKVYDSFDNIVECITSCDTDIIIVNASLIDSDTLSNLIKTDARLVSNKLILLSQFNPGVDLQSAVKGVWLYNQSESEIIESVKALLAESDNNLSNNEDVLSKREQDTLRLIALGLTQKEIADKLFISTHTVVSHRKNITRKLGIKTVSGLTVYAILNNLITMDEIKE
ncbi:MAG: response regulator transcription factor [Bacteroidales bacterium]|nr:response regulator transcription factor [Bacteroidales bacterium]